MSTRTARSQAVNAYLDATQYGASPEQAAQAAWLAVRQPHERAPNWDTKWEANTGQRGSFRSPLGDALGLYTGEFGHHCKNWRITSQALEECGEARKTVLAYLKAAATRKQRNMRRAAREAQAAAQARHLTNRTRWEILSA